jgi:enoyl-CoA hydratase/carnithine racemase
MGRDSKTLRIVGPAKTKEIINTGKMITAEEAEPVRWGYHIHSKIG